MFEPTTPNHFNHSTVEPPDFSSPTRCPTTTDLPQVPPRRRAPAAAAAAAAAAAGLSTVQRGENAIGAQPLGALEMSGVDDTQQGW